MSDETPHVQVVPGEMQPWTDLGPDAPPAGGEPVRRWLADVLLPRADRALVLGPHDDDLLRLVAERAGAVTVLLRSPSDARETAERLAGLPLTVVAGSLDGFAATTDDRFPLVVAVDGLDRVLSTDSPVLSWLERRDLVAGLTAEGGTVLLSLDNELSLGELLDARPPAQRHGDQEWRPLHSDRTRPTSAAALRAAVSGPGDAPLWAVFGERWRGGHGRHVVIGTDALDVVDPGSPLVGVVLGAARETGRPLLADPAEVVSLAARARALATVPDAWLTVVGPGAGGRDLYAALGGVVLTARHSGPEAPAWDVEDAATVPGAADAPPADPVEVTAAALPPSVPDRPSVAEALLLLAEAEDVPGVRALAGRVGQWLRAAGPGRDVVVLDGLHEDGDGFARGLVPWRWAEAPSVELATATAWYRWQDELLSGSHRHPWPPWVVGEQLVRTLAQMSGVEVDDEQLAGARAAADALAALDVARHEAPDVRAALARAENAERELFELRGHVFGLERTLGFRDQQLRSRDAKILQLRRDVVTLEKVRSSTAYTMVRRAAMVRHPRTFAGKVRKRARQEIKKRLR